jgi:shikimate 5-dehydrogenase
MLLGQGVETFEILTGQKAPLEVMKDALTNLLTGKPGEDE